VETVTAQKVAAPKEKGFNGATLGRAWKLGIRLVNAAPNARLQWGHAR